jgi:hypothetical protein
LRLGSGAIFFCGCVAFACFLSRWPAAGVAEASVNTHSPVRARRQTRDTRSFSQSTQTAAETNSMPCYARVSVSSEGEQHSDTGCCVVGQGVWTGFYWAQRKQEVKKAAAHGPRNEGLTSLSPGSDFFQLTRAGHRLGVDLQSGDLGPNLGVVPRRELLWQRSTMWFELWFPGAVLFNTNEVLNNPLLSPVTQASLGGLCPLLIWFPF